MVVRNKVDVEDGTFQRKLKLVVLRTLPIVMASGTLFLTDCGPVQVTEKTPEVTQEKNDFPEVTVVDGRRPDGLQPMETAGHYNDLSDQEVLSALFAQSAFLESAAVVAFEHLARELEEYNAPAPLIRVAYEAVQEEIEHARLMTQLASHFGSAVIPEVKVEPFVLRPLHEIAYENALEGCTRETYGALKALWQSETAGSPEVREVTAQVGHDESRHAALSWAIDAWVRPQLNKAQNEACDRVQAEGLAALRQETSRRVHPALLQWAGYPSPQAAGLLLQESFSV